MTSNVLILITSSYLKIETMTPKMFSIQQQMCVIIVVFILWLLIVLQENAKVEFINGIEAHLEKDVIILGPTDYVAGSNVKYFQMISW